MNTTDYIKNELLRNSACSIEIASNIKPVNIDTNKVKSILNKKYTSAQNMESVLCMFKTMFISSINIDNIPVVDKKIDTWIKNLKSLSSGQYGEVYIADIISNIDIIIKVPLQTASYTDVIREYFIGVTMINSLRYYIPNFVYTLGAFQCGDIKKNCNGKPKLMIMYEKIKGQGLFYKIKDRGFDWFLNIFAQLLIALEIAQRSIGFCHYDLHSLNVMIREERVNYVGLIDNVSYKVSTNEYPVIIDFGMSCVRYKGEDIGNTGLSQSNIFPFCVQGKDVGMFLNSVYVYNSDIACKDKISKLASYLGIDIFKTSMSLHFNKTPLEILSKILLNPQYSAIISNTITIGDRKELIPIHYDTVKNIYLNILKTKSDQTELALSKCINNPLIYKSYILSNTVRTIASGIKFSEITNNLNMIMKNNKDEMIEYDLDRLQGYKNISTITSEILGISKSLLKQDVSTLYAKCYFTPNRKKQIISDIADFNKIYTNFKQILPYLDMIYTIRWHGLEKEYESFLTEFNNSPQYKNYIIYKDTMNSTSRWVKSLASDITSDNK